MIIAIDGPAASGKGTLARRLAAHYRLPLLDTGALYRAVALAVIEAGASPSDAQAAIRAARTLDPALADDPRVRSAEIGQGASKVAAVPEVRAALLEVQRRFARTPGGAILDGRDIGTVICPDADFKFFVTAAPHVRARRRWKELSEGGQVTSLDEVAAQLAERDARDSGRRDAPLGRAEDAVLLDTTDLSIDAAVEAARRIIDVGLA
jgi:cytidylate kinase